MSLSTLSSRKVCLVATFVICMMAILAFSSTDENPSSTTKSRVPDQSTMQILGIQTPEEVSAVIYPIRSATVPSEVRGLVDRIDYKEGDNVEQGAVVAEISKDRHKAIVDEFLGNLNVAITSLEKAQEDYKVQKELHDKRAATFQDVIKAKYDVKTLEAQVQQAEAKLKQARLNLEACVVNAPFKGKIAVLYKNPNEAIDNLEKVFELVDACQVYARANWPESRLAEIELGKTASFVYKGKTFEGVIQKMSPLIDPASKTKRISVLINNPDDALQIGMSGSLHLK